MDSRVISLSDTHKPVEKVSLLRPISALEEARNEDGTSKPGLISQLGPGTTVECCGDGFDDRTVKVQARGRSYFVFLQDLESQGNEN